MAPLVLVSLAAVLIVMLAEIAVLGYRKSSARALLNPDASARRDMLSYLLDVTGTLRVMGHIVTLGAGYMVGKYVHQQLDINLTGVFANPMAQVGFWFLAKSFFDYWMHRLMHTVPFLWEIHKYHHSAAEMNVVTAHRESILVAPFSSLYFAIPLGIIGTPTTTFIAVALVAEIHAVLVHSQFKFTWGRIGEYLLISPRAHRVHHSLDERHWGHNYGFMFSFWDHAFGSFLKVPEEEIAVGVVGGPYNAVGWHQEMIYSIKASGSEFAKAMRRAARFARPAPK
jgi:sterol desaturase/sphingolipid hydroxylase (fatty acid hydroxylase superfamily)